MEHALGPTQIAILGGSGDLAKRKLIPALFDLFVRGALPEQFNIIGLARTPRTDEAYRVFVTEAIQSHGHTHTEADIHAFCTHVTYVTGSFSDATSYQALKTAVETYTSSIGMCANTLFYLAVPPEHYETIFDHLHKNNMHAPCDTEHGWTRVLVEKPFGKDRATAQALDEKLCRLFNEEQIFRIDHYLAKEAVQNILSFRFANTLTKEAWHGQNIEKIDITMSETVDVQHRGAFYDGVGALRDVGQNHLLQLLALVTMDEPTGFTAAAVREARTNILQKLKPITADTIEAQYTRAQYEGYTAAEGVAPDSATETAFTLQTYIDTPEWEGVPITLQAGKALAEGYVTVTIFFKDVATGPFKNTNCATTGNQITLTIQPEQKMEITLNAKAAGLGYTIESRTLSLTCNKGFEEITNAYERVLIDCIRGDQTLFTTGAEVLAQWSFINSVLDNQANVPLTSYAPGSPDIMSTYEKNR